jgi:hypothetical protein
MLSWSAAAHITLRGDFEIHARDIPGGSASPIRTVDALATS